MASIPSKVASRLAAGIKKFQPILKEAEGKEVGESDTVTIVIAILSEVFGYDQFREITSEKAVKSTWCDLAIKLNDNTNPCLMIEVKKISMELKKKHVDQVGFYGSRDGTKWVIVTNGIHWQVYKIIYGDAPDEELVVEFDFLKLNHKSVSDLETLQWVTKEGIIRCCLDDYDAHMQAMSRFSLAATILSEPVIEVIRRELRKLSPGARITVEEIDEALKKHVFKGEVVEDPKAEEARKRIAKAQGKASKKSAKSDSTSKPILASGSPLAENQPQNSPLPQKPSTV